MSVWDGDFNRTLAEYNGTLKERLCDYCGRSILSDELAKYHQEYGRICVDCVDTVREETRIWRRQDGE